jgi:signal peptidase I
MADESDKPDENNDDRAAQADAAAGAGKGRDDAPEAAVEGDPASEKTASEKTASEKTASEKTASEKTAGARPASAIDASEPRPSGASRLLRLVYWVVFFFVIPFALACLLVWALTPPSGLEPQGAFAAVQNIVREQPVPIVIVCFTLFETAIWFARHKLPLAAYAYPPLPPGVGAELRPSFERARALIDEATRLMEGPGKDLAKKHKETVRDALGDLESAMETRPFEEGAFSEALLRAEEVVDGKLGAWRKSELREYLESIGIAVAIAVAARQFAAEAFKIPSGSMIPTLQVGDHIFVNKLVYGPTLPFTRSRIYTRMPPERGDVMVFQFPEHPEQDFIKRVIAIPGDVLEARNGHPWLNGWEVPSCFVGVYSYAEPETQTRHQGDLYVEFLEDEAYLTLYDHTAGAFPETQGPFKVAEGEVWVMGDNRHNSHDSRMWFGGQGGGVPFANIKGRAAFVWLSMGDKGIQWGRFGAPVMGRPRLPPAMSHLEGGLTKCLKERPPLDKTQPPPPGRGPIPSTKKSPEPLEAP